MTVIERARAPRIIVALCAVIVLGGLVLSVGAQQPTGKFLNVQTLKDLNPTQLHDAMVFMTVSVGSTCETCHVRTADGQMAFDKDDKRSKATARKMIEMVNAINTRDFNSESQVNCMTCHQGRLSPMGTPQLAQPAPAGQTPGAPGAPQGPVGTPGPGAAPGPGGRPKPPTETVDEVVTKYVDALGGRDALVKIIARTRKGTVTNRAGQASLVTIDEKAPGLYLATVGSTPPSRQGLNASGAWTASGDRARDLIGVEGGALAAVADLTLPTEMTKRYTGLQARSYGTIDGHDVIVLTGRSSPDVMETLSFDRATGFLLRRVIRFTLSMGRLPMQIDYADYRAVGGVKMPFEVRVTDWSTISAEKFTDIVLNPSLDDARFARPAAKRP
jgi:hypothetical protein